MDVSWDVSWDLEGIQLGDLGLIGFLNGISCDFM